MSEKTVAEAREALDKALTACRLHELVSMGAEYGVIEKFIRAVLAASLAPKPNTLALALSVAQAEQLAAEEGDSAAYEYLRDAAKNLLNEKPKAEAAGSPCPTCGKCPCYEHERVTVCPSPEDVLLDSIARRKAGEPSREAPEPQTENSTLVQGSPVGDNRKGPARESEHIGRAATPDGSESSVVGNVTEQQGDPGNVPASLALNQGCSFCGNGRQGRAKMFTGNPGVAICDECVLLCVEGSLKERHGRSTRAATTGDSHEREGSVSKEEKAQTAAKAALVRGNDPAGNLSARATGKGAGLAQEIESQTMDAGSGVANSQGRNAHAATGAPEPVHPSQEQPAASGPGKPSGGAPSDDVEFAARKFWEEWDRRSEPSGERAENWPEEVAFFRRVIEHGFEAGAASRDAEVAQAHGAIKYQCNELLAAKEREEAYERFVDWLDGAMDWDDPNCDELNVKFTALRSELAALEGKGGGKA